MLKKKDKMRSDSSVTFTQGSLKAGMYLYGLYVNGDEVDIKRMIIQ